MNRPGTPLPAWLREHHREATRPRPVSPAPDGLGPSRTHCWVAGPVDAPGWWPAVLVQWRLTPAGWSAQVAYVVNATATGTGAVEAAEAASAGPSGARDSDAGGGDPVLVLAWVDADQLRPA